jgi:hypothetical protein
MQEPQWDADAVTLVQLYWSAAVNAAQVARSLAEHEFLRPIEKDAAIRKIVTEGDNGGKPHSYSSAEKIVESEPGYAQICAEVRNLQYAVERERATAAAYKALIAIRTAMITNPTPTE